MDTFHADHGEMILAIAAVAEAHHLARDGQLGTGVFQNPHRIGT